MSFTIGGVEYAGDPYDDDPSGPVPMDVYRSGGFELPTDTVYRSPEPSTAVGSWYDRLAQGISGGASILRSVAGVVAQRDQLQDAREDRALQRYSRTTELGLRRDLIGTEAEITRARAAQQLAVARGQTMPGALSSNTIMLALTAAGVYFGWRALKK